MTPRLAKLRSRAAQVLGLAALSLAIVHCSTDVSYLGAGSTMTSLDPNAGSGGDAVDAGGDGALGGMTSAGSGGASAGGNGGGAGRGGSGGTGGSGGKGGGGKGGGGGSGGGAGSAGSANGGSAGGSATGLRFAELCQVSRVAIISNGAAADTNAASSVVASIDSACGTTLPVRTAQANDPSVQEATTHRPITGPAELCAIGGGPFTQTAMAYLEMTATSIFSRSAPPTFSIVERATGKTVASYAISSFNANHDMAVIQVAREPKSQTLIVNVYGYGATGTQVGAFYFAQTLLSGLTSNPHIWYVIEWHDTNLNGKPDGSDDYQVISD